MGEITFIKIARTNLYDSCARASKSDADFRRETRDSCVEFRTRNIFCSFVKISTKLCKFYYRVGCSKNPRRVMNYVLVN